jgi:hypothetical protein
MLTSAHCLCSNPTTITVQFARDNGTLAVSGEADFEEFPVTARSFPSMAQVCGTDYATYSDDDPDFYAAWDIAVLNLGPSTQQNRLPPITPVKVFLGDNDAAWSAQRLKPFRADPSGGLQTGDTLYYQAAGFGKNVATLDEGSGCLGCNLRRWAGMNSVTFASDSCTPLDPEIDCYDTPRWRAATVSAGNTAEFSKGDSGGPLVMLDSVTGDQVIVGTASGFYDDPLYTEDHVLRWSQTGVNNDFIWERLGLPPTATLANVKQTAAVYVNGGGVFIDDRAKVIKVQNGVEYGADIVQSSTYSSIYFNRVGVEALVGNVTAKDRVYLADRCRVGNVTSTSWISRGNAVASGNITQGTYVHPEGLSLSAPSYNPSGRPNKEIMNRATLYLTPGAYGDVTVRQGGTLVLRGGLYQFKSLTVNAGGFVRRTDLNDSAKTWLFIYGTTMDFQGQLYANMGTVLVGLPNSTYVFINNQFVATLVAPKASVNADLSSAHASLVGSVFAASLTLHQGSVIAYVPFTSNWVPVCTSGYTNCT